MDFMYEILGKAAFTELIRVVIVSTVVTPRPTWLDTHHWNLFFGETGARMLMIVVNWYPCWRSSPVQPERNPRHHDNQAWRDVDLESLAGNDSFKCVSVSLKINHFMDSTSTKIVQRRPAMISQEAGWANTWLEKLANLSEVANEPKLGWCRRWGPKLFKPDKIR